MTAPPFEPHTLVVARGWLELVTPAAVRADVDVPAAGDALRTVGFVRVSLAGGSPSLENPMRHPVVTAACFVAPPAAESQLVPWNAAIRLAGWVKDATDDPAYLGVELDLTGFGDYRPARVHTVVALSEPRQVRGDPSNFARFDVDLHFHWTGAT